MKEKETIEELKVLLESLQTALELYNSISSEAKLELVKQDETKDISKVFVCVYNDGFVGLFRNINWSTPLNHWGGYSAGNVYVGIGSDYIGMKETHDGFIPKRHWTEVGTKIKTEDGKSYVTNCNMQNAMSFDDMRLIMYKEGLIGPYEIGKATSQEMLEVLKYASSYYQLDQSEQMRRTRNSGNKNKQNSETADNL